MIWSWDVPTETCFGEPETDALVYLVEQSAMYLTDWVLPCEGCDLQPVYSPRIVLSSDIVPDARFPDALVVVPPLGGITFLHIDSIDPAGNTSRLCEGP